VVLRPGDRDHGRGGHGSVAGGRRVAGGFALAEKVSTPPGERCPGSPGRFRLRIASLRSPNIALALTRSARRCRRRGRMVPPRPPRRTRRRLRRGAASTGDRRLPRWLAQRDRIAPPRTGSRRGDARAAWNRVKRLSSAGPVRDANVLDLFRAAAAAGIGPDRGAAARLSNGTAGRRDHRTNLGRAAAASGPRIVVPGGRAGWTRGPPQRPFDWVIVIALRRHRGTGQP
jgi:hypothetical protein